MKRRYAVLRASEWHKVYDDRVTNYLRTDGFHPTDGIRTDHGEFIKVDTPDDEILSKNKYYLMTLEELPDRPRATAGQPEPYIEFIEDRRKRDNGDITVPSPGARMFRGTK